MMPLPLVRGGERLRILCLGAHADDIEIGAGGTILALIAAGHRIDVHWCVLSGNAERARESLKSAEAFLDGAASRTVELGNFDDSYFPNQSREIKDWLKNIQTRVEPDVIFTHSRHDAHQDHREVNRITSNIFRNHLILEYEIPKWDGDISERNTYIQLNTEILEKKIALLNKYFATQRSKDWFDSEVFRGLARLRGMECRSPSNFAEAFTIRKLTIG
ncbi:MAG: PIG-L family deacetylase [Shinella sp.]|nr:PIG-L family deacetylase [Shinella sp.]